MTQESGFQKDIAILVDGESVVASTPALPWPPERLLSNILKSEPEVKEALEGKGGRYHVEIGSRLKEIRVVPLHMREKRSMLVLITEPQLSPLDDLLQMLGKLMDSVNSICVVIDTRGNILIYNREAEKALGYRREEVVGKNWFSIFYEKPHPDFIRKFTQTTGEGLPTKNLSVVRKKDGSEIFITWSNTYLETEDNKAVIVGIGQDVTEEITLRKRIEEEKKIQELLLDMLSHDLGNYIQAARGYIDIVNMVGKPDEKTQKYLKKSEEVLAEIMKLVENVKNLTVIRNREPSLEPKDLKSIITHSWDLVLNSLSEDSLKSADLKIDFEGEEYQILCDFSILHVFQNLFTNAIEHNDKDNVLVKVGVVGREENSITMYVEDNGPGIPPEMRERIFMRLDRGINEGKISGSGLGLSIVKLAVERLGGKIWLEGGKELGGARFVLKLPAK